MREATLMRFEAMVMAAGGGVCNCAYTDLCHRRIHYPAAASPYRILRITLRSFLFPWFTSAHHHPQLSRIIYQNIIYTEFGLPNSSFSLLRRYMRVWILFLFYFIYFFWPQKTWALILLSVWTELKVMLWSHFKHVFFPHLFSKLLLILLFFCLLFTSFEALLLAISPEG